MTRSRCCRCCSTCCGATSSSTDLSRAAARGHPGPRWSGGGDETGRAQVLRPGDWVRLRRGEHQVVALAGTSVRLRVARRRREQVVLVTYLMASPGFAVVDGAPLPAVEPFGLLDGLPLKTLRERACSGPARRSRSRPDGRRDADPGTPPRPEYDTATTTRGPARAGQGRRAGRERAHDPGPAARYAARASGAWSTSGRPGTARSPAAPTRGWWRRSGKRWTPRRTPRPAPGRG